MTMKEKYPIGSQWECRDGSRAVVVDYEYGELVVAYISRMGHSTQFKFDGTHWSNPNLNLVKPWKEKRVFKDEVLVVSEGNYIALYLRKEDLDYVDDKELERRYDIIARMPIKITEGDGLD